MTLPLRQRTQYEKGGVGRWYWDYRDRLTLSHIAEQKVILDAGCGEGITLERLIRQFPDREIMGIDYAPENVAICGQKGLPARVGIVYSLPYANASVDCCLFMEVIEHLQEPGKALEEISRVLRKNGLLLLLFPNDLLFKLARLTFLKFKEAFAPSGHVKQWSPGKMKKALERTGFRIQAVQCLPFPYWPLCLHCLTVARKK